MAAKKIHYVGYKMAKNYRSVTIWSFLNATQRLTTVIKTTPNPQFSRRVKYRQCCKALKAFGVKAPPKFEAKNG